jgi:N-ethylmaleimide reductase
MFSEFNLGKLRLPNRIVMAPMTRSRVDERNAPTAMNARYYAQRASSGLIISEAIVVSPQARGCHSTPGLYSPAQLLGWTHVVDSVHLANGRIFAQLWHVGRVSHPSVLPAGCVPLSSTDERLEGLETFALATDGRPGKVNVSKPRAMLQRDIDEAVKQFVRAAGNALYAGFDGIETLAANGYLFEQFLNSIINTRTDRYGGQNPQNRCRFLLEVLDAIAMELDGLLPVGVRLSPYGFFNGMPADPHTEETYLYLASQLRDRQIAYVHFNDEPVSIGHLNAAINDASSAETRRLIPQEFLSRFKASFAGPLMLCGALNANTANQFLARGEVDLVAFGVPFIGNPDLPERFMNNWSLNEADPDLFYGGNEKGYVDYPHYR